MRRRTILSSFLVIAGTTVALPGPGGGVAPAGAQTPAAEAAVSGNFFGDDRDEVFLYSGVDDVEPNDTMLSFDNGGVPGDPVTVTAFTHDVRGQFVPLPGDFDGDGLDEILWYGAGAAPDVLWDFTDFTAHTETPVTVTGVYRPVVGDFTGDTVDDILWYAPGSAVDTLWEFNVGGGHTAVSRPVRGTYRPQVASVGKDNTDDILWYAPGSAADTLWDFTQGTTSFTTRQIPVSGTYRAFTLDVFGDGWRGGDFFWYAPGPGTDTYWDYFLGARIQSFIDPVQGDHLPVSGDFFGDLQDDVLWLNDTAPVLWEHNDGMRSVYVFGPAASASSASSASSAASALGTTDGVAASSQQDITRSRG
jgi:hypothetical protein